MVATKGENRGGGIFRVALFSKGVDYYGTRMETNVFVFTLFFLFPSLFSWYDIVQVPTNLGSRYSAFFL